MIMTLITPNGEQYFSRDTDEIDAEKAATELYDTIERLGKFQMELEDGYLVAGEDILKNSIVIFKNTQNET